MSFAFKNIKYFVVEKLFKMEPSSKFEGIKSLTFLGLYSNRGNLMFRR